MIKLVIYSSLILFYIITRITIFKTKFHAPLFIIINLVCLFFLIDLYQSFIISFLVTEIICYNEELVSTYWNQIIDKLEKKETFENRNADISNKKKDKYLDLLYDWYLSRMFNGVVVI